LSCSCHRGRSHEDAKLAKACIQAAVAFLIEIDVFRSVILQALESEAERMRRE